MLQRQSTISELPETILRPQPKSLHSTLRTTGQRTVDWLSAQDSESEPESDPEPDPVSEC
jgi:hypothetical protein